MNSVKPWDSLNQGQDPEMACGKRERRRGTYPSAVSIPHTAAQFIAVDMHCRPIFRLINAPAATYTPEHSPRTNRAHLRPFSIRSLHPFEYPLTLFPYFCGFSASTAVVIISQPSCLSTGEQILAIASIVSLAASTRFKWQDFRFECT
jgi:hypothetical protein